MISVKNMPKVVMTTFRKCQVKEGEISQKNIIVEGITKKFKFNAERLANHRQIIKEILRKLSRKFESGETFLNICQTKEGKIWTGFQSICEKLVVMAIGLGLMRYCSRKEHWVLLPGKVPYISIIKK